jgi:hypothetical protein
MFQNKVCKGSGVYVNGIAMTIISTTLVIIRRNGFRAISLITGESISHRGTVVVLSDNCVVIKGGKPVHVMNPDRMFRCGYSEVMKPAERYTVQNGETKRFNPLQCLVGGNMMKINSSVFFSDYWSDNAGQPQYKDDGEFWAISVVKRGEKKFIGYHEFN